MALFCLASARIPAQQFDILLRGGRVIDPANHIDRPMDVAVAGNRIAVVSTHLAEQREA